MAVTVSPTLTLLENADAGSGNIVIYQSWDDAVFETIPVTDGRVGIVNNVVTINPTGTLQRGLPYSVNIAASCIKDVAGNPFAGISDSTSWRFTTTEPLKTWTQTKATTGNLRPTRIHGASTVFDGKIWLVGGQGGGGRTNDVWWSSDGVIASSCSTGKCG